MAGQRIAASAQANSSSTADPSGGGPGAGPGVGAGAAAAAQAKQLRAAQSRQSGRAAGRGARGAVRGIRGFFRPFTRVGGILWLEVTGFFFLLFAAIFGTATWRTRPVMLHGPYGKPFFASGAMLLIFFYLGVTSFLSARRK
jgi:hypothetical protein